MKPQETQSESRPTPRTLAIARLGVREYGTEELIRYLQRKGYSEDEATSTVGDLAREGMLDDRRYARVIARAQAMRGKGPLYVRAKLQAKGVRMELREIQVIMAEVAPQSDLDSAQKIIERRYPRWKEDARQKQRAYQGLLRRGFTAEVARKCLTP